MFAVKSVIFCLKSEVLISKIWQFYFEIDHFDLKISEFCFEIGHNNTNWASFSQKSIILFRNHSQYFEIFRNFGSKFAHFIQNESNW